MAQNFLACDRDQELLVPPSLREWLPEDHLAWFVLDAVDEIDLSGFYAQALADTFVQVLALCASAGLVSAGLVALDGSLLAGNASPGATGSYAWIRERSSRGSHRLRRRTLTWTSAWRRARR